jgi:DeoR/GlpR family transcriptional regulator of sugar metabolism
MKIDDRHSQIVKLVNEKGFLSVTELSGLFDVSEMTIRRDLDILVKDNFVRRTFGGVAAVATERDGSKYGNDAPDNALQQTAKTDNILTDRIDVVIASSVNPKYDGRLLESITRKNIPIITESLAIQDEETVVAVDNFKAGRDLGIWAGEFVRKNWNKAYVLDLSYSLSNTQARSRGFAAGIREANPDTEIVLSINAQSRYSTAYQLTRDALTVHRNINVIFAINDATALGALNACRDLGIDRGSLIIIPFGLEGDRIKNALLEQEYCQAGLAMFPEIVGPTCIEAAIAAYNHEPLPRQLITPYVIVTPETMQDIYTNANGAWRINWDNVKGRLEIPLPIDPDLHLAARLLPHRIGFIIPFSEHDWYKKLIISMKDHARSLHIDFEVIDADQNIKDEIDIRRQLIAKLAAQQIEEDDVVIIDGGLIGEYLAEAILERKSITVITNSVSVFDILKTNPNLILILTGGAYRHSSQMLVGPTAEGALRELRADKLFLMVAGASLNFGLSHTNISEVTMKQAMIRSAKEVILLADHTYFGQESIIQVAPLTAVNKLITDDALPASIRLELTKLGIQIILANQ